MYIVESIEKELQSHIDRLVSQEGFSREEAVDDAIDNFLPDVIDNLLPQITEQVIVNIENANGI